MVVCCCCQPVVCPTESVVLQSFDFKKKKYFERKVWETLSTEMCGGFTCSKNALTALNILYILVAFVLIGVAVYCQESAIVINLPIIGGILACGVFLVLVSILGLIGAVKHHQVVLFFYMVILFCLFFVQLSIAAACLAVNKDQQKEIARKGWNSVPPDVKNRVMQKFNCCGFDNSTDHQDPFIPCPAPKLESCSEKLQETIDYAFRLCGGFGMFFSFTEFIGVWLTVRYRNQKDPRTNPSAFL